MKIIRFQDSFEAVPFAFGLFLVIVLAGGCGQIQNLAASADSNSLSLTNRTSNESSAAQKGAVGQPASNQSAASNLPADCGDYPVGSVECAVTKNPTNRQFSLEITKPDGSRRTYKGERIQIGQEAIILHVTITGAGAESDGEWWDKLSGDGQTTDARNTFRKENGVWARRTRKPREQEYQNLILASGVVQPIDIAAAYPPEKIGEEIINGENCNRFQIKYIGDGSRSVTDIWISKRSGYALRRQMNANNQTTIINESRQGENIQIETPPGAD